MKNKLHKNTIPCHAELLTEHSRSAASHKLHKPMFHVELVETSLFPISKLLNFQILSFFFLLFSFFCSAQSYNWQWAMKGGGSLGGIDEEQIYDVKVGTDGNYYFIGAMIGNQNNQLNGQTVSTYNVPMSGNDIFLFSTTCDGQVRWKYTMGGGSSDFAYNLVLDNNNNVYVAANMGWGYSGTSGTFPVHFSPADALPSSPGGSNVVSDYWKTTFLVKFSSTGQYLGKKALQGNVDDTTTASQVLDLVIDSQNNLHFIVGLLKGTHLDNQVTVPTQFAYDPSTWTYNFQYRLVKYNTNLNFISSMELPISSNSVFEGGKTKFAYDENLNRYYIAGEVQNSGQIVYNGDGNVNKSFIIAFNGSNGNEVWRREVYADPTNGLADNRFNSLKIDSNSDVYFGGRVYQSTNSQNPIKIYDPTDTSIPDYLHTPTVNTTIPTLVKFNSSGTVQWVKTPTAFASNFSSGTPIIPGGLALNGNEIAFGSSEAYFVWDGFTQNNPQSYQPDPTLLRFNKQTGQTIGMHTIKGDAGTRQSMTAVATDNDGNYITAGSFQANLFMSNTLGITPLISTGEADFFVAKLAAKACGTNVSTEDFNTMVVKVYPNPTTDILNIETPETLEHYEVYNVLGQQIQKGIFNGTNQISLHGATAGTYFVKVTTQKGDVATVKVIKK